VALLDAVASRGVKATWVWFVPDHPATAQRSPPNITCHESLTMRLHGVFVGVDHYVDDCIPDLRFAAADAIRYESVVANSVDESERCLRCLTNENATRSNIFKAIGIDLASAATAHDVVLVHFSGHGSPEVGISLDDAARYLIPHDADYDNLFGSALDLERDLRALLQRITAQLVIVSIDACFSGVAGGRTFEGPKLKQAKRSRRWVPQLPAMELGSGKVVLAAADDNELAVESAAIKHGLFTNALLDGLTTLPTGGAKSISVAALYDIVAQRVSAETRGKQNPVMNGFNRLARLPYFVRWEG
jgi:hypothetical protein